MKKFEDSKAWQRARLLNQKIHKLTTREPFNKDYRFKSQFESSGGSIMDNIAEGFERGGNNELINFLIYSKGSGGEVKSQSYRALDKGYISKEEFADVYKDADEIGGMLKNWIEYLKNSDLKGRYRKK
jgi:four helix bundle protein